MRGVLNGNQPGARVDYGYDANGARVWSLKGGVATYEVNDHAGNQLIEYTPAQAGKLVEHVYLGGKRIAQRVSP